MRILQLAPPWFAVPPTGYGGIEWVVAALADGLVDQGHEVTLLASGGSRTKARLQSVFDDPPSARLGDPWCEAEQVLAAYQQRGDFDLIHDHSGVVGLVAAGLASGPPVVHTLHGPWTPANADVYRRVAERVHLVAISHDQAAAAPPSVRIAGVVHNGIRTDCYPFQTRKEDYLLFVGRANHEKGPAIAIEVARRVGLPLVMVMKVNEGPELRYFEEVVRPVLQQASVDLRTRVSPEEKADLMGRAKAVLFPIQWDEPFGLVMAESNACGTPVIAFARGAAPEVLAHGETGWLAAPGDIEAMVAAVERCDEIDPGACRARVERLFSARAMVEGYLDVYDRVLTDRR